MNMKRMRRLLALLLALLLAASAGALAEAAPAEVVAEDSGGLEVFLQELSFLLQGFEAQGKQVAVVLQLAVSPGFVSEHQVGGDDLAEGQDDGEDQHFLSSQYMERVTLPPS